MQLICGELLIVVGLLWLTAIGKYVFSVVIGYRDRQIVSYTAMF